MYVHNKAGTDIKLTVEQSGDKNAAPFIEALIGPRGEDMKPSPSNVTRIGVGQIFTSDLGIRFTQAPGTGDIDFIVNFTAEATTKPARESDFLIVNHNRFKNFFQIHSADNITETSFSTFPLESMNRYAVIYFEPAWSNYNNLKNNMQNLSQYVRDGGVAVINIAGNIGSGDDIDPLGTDYNRSHTHSSEQILLPNHAYITGQGYPGVALSTSDFANWSSTDHGWLTGLPQTADSVLTDDHGVSWLQYSYGQGTVIVTTLTYGWGLGGAKGDPLKNLVEYSLFLGGGARQ